MSGELACLNCGSTDVAGIEVRGVYDGVLIWLCQNCETQWPRFPGGKHHRQALELMEKWKQHDEA